MAVSDYKTNPDLNVTISGINIAEGCPPSGINNAIRQMMADIKIETNAIDSAVVHKTGAETIAGAKTFSSTPKVGADNVLTTSTGLRLGAGNEVTYGQLIHRNIDTSYIRISGGSAVNTGGQLLLYGENAESTPGEARLYANDGTTSKILIAKPDGTLTWGGSNIVTESNGTAPRSVRDGSGNTIATTYATKTELSGKADDSAVVHNTGNETVSGVKTFSSTPTVNGNNVLTTATGFQLGAKNAAMSAQILHRSVGTSLIRISGGSDTNVGAAMVLYGESEGTNPGQVTLHASNTSATKQLIAKPDGTLTWGGQPLQTTSDERLKTAFSAVPDAVLDAWGKVEWFRFKYLEDVERKGASARWHTGLVAQRVKAVFEVRGLDACEYGILCHEIWDDEYDEDGNIIREAGDLWTVRYEEAFAMEAAYQRRRMDRIEAILAGE